MQTASKRVKRYMHKDAYKYEWMCIHTCAHIGKDLHVEKHTHGLKGAHINLHMQTKRYMHSLAHTFQKLYTWTNRHVRTEVHANKQTHKHTHTHAYEKVYKRTNRRIRKDIHINTHLYESHTCPLCLQNSFYFSAQHHYKHHEYCLLLNRNRIVYKELF